MSKRRIREPEDWPQRGELWMGVPFGRPVLLGTDEGVGENLYGTPGEVGCFEGGEWTTDEVGEVTIYTMTFKRYRPDAAECEARGPIKLRPGDGVTAEELAELKELVGDEIELAPDSKG